MAIIFKKNTLILSNRLINENILVKEKVKKQINMLLNEVIISLIILILLRDFQHLVNIK